MAKVLERPTEQSDTRAEREDLDRRYQRLQEALPDARVEIISGRIVVREMTTVQHAKLVFQLLLQLIPVMTERGWANLNDVKLFLHAQVDRYIPDLTIVPPDLRTWGEDAVHGDSTLLVVEVVSTSSVHDDHVVKPRNCAQAGVPLYLVIDAFQGIAKLLSDPGKDGYTGEVTVSLGKPLPLPAPWDLTIDTGKLID